MEAAKERLGLETGDPDYDNPRTLSREKNLKQWLDQTSIPEILDWFVAWERPDRVTEYGRSKRPYETAVRDLIFLERMNVIYPTGY